MIREQLRNSRHRIKKRTETLALPSGEEKEELVRNLGINKKAEKAKKVADKLSFFDNLLKKETYFVGTIKELCFKYNLYFEPMDMTNFHFSDKILDKILAYCKEIDLPLSECRDKFFVLHSKGKNYMIFYVHNEKDTSYRSIKSEDNVTTLVINNNFRVNRFRCLLDFFNFTERHELLSIGTFNIIFLTFMGLSMLLTLSTIPFGVIFLFITIFTFLIGLNTFTSDTIEKNKKRIWKNI